MSVSSFAQRLLFGNTLEDKLARLGALRDIPGPALASAPSSPGRPTELRLDRGGRAVFPSRRELETEQGRARALHHFANHELLAIELMALALLRFPEAEQDFRLDLVRTIAEEQRHLRSYLSRMRDLGLEFGELPVNGWFWRCLSNMDSPIDHAVRMSLTFEQANLDFAAFYRDSFRALGDSDTALLLDGVYEDEIRHVAVGLKWFDRWRPSGASRFDAYKALLPFPLTPARAKGQQHFDVHARRRAGLDEEMIRAIRASTWSKGRPGACWLPNLGAEHALAGATLSPAATELVDDLAPLVGFLARPEDVVVVARGPSASWRACMAERGVMLPTYVSSDGLTGPFSSVEPWARTPDQEAIELEGPRGSIRPSPGPGPRWFRKDHHVSRLAEVRNALTREQQAALHPADLDPIVVTSLTELSEAEERWPDRTLVLRAPLGSSGHGQRRSSLPLSGRSMSWVRRVIEGQGSVCVAPEWHILADLSVLIDTRPRRPKLKLTSPIIDHRGAYRGHWLRSSVVPEGLRDAFYRPGLGRASAHATLLAVAEAIALGLTEDGYTGSASMDAALVKVDGDICLLPYFEVNPRWTMGWVANRLSKLLRPGPHAAWLHLPRARALEALGSIDGLIATTDPSSVRRVLTLIICCKDDVELQERVRALLK